MANMAALDIVKVAYGIGFICVLIAEFYPRGVVSRRAALASIALVIVGGAAWAYAAFLTHTPWPQFAAFYRAAQESDAGKGGGAIMSNDDEDSEGDLGEDGGGDASSGGSTVDGRDGASQAADGASSEIDGSAHRRKRKIGGGADLVTDCEDCPPLLTVPAGTAMIGANANDREALAAELPSVPVRFWPGFMIGADPVAAESFRNFQVDTNRHPARCGPQTADLTPLAQRDIALASVLSATCVTPGEADAYVNWLTARTGKRFRLATAAEWEYAAQVLPAPGLAIGGVAEIVADCWHERVPLQGMERIASATDSGICGGRMLKGAGPFEDAHWHRFSARRHIDAHETGATVGFRVMRSYDGVR